MALIVGIGLLQAAEAVDRATRSATRLQLVPSGTERAVLIRLDIEAGIETHAVAPALQPCAIAVVVRQQQVYGVVHQYACRPNRAQRDAPRPLLLLPVVPRLRRGTSGRPAPLGHRHADDDALLDRQLRPLHGLGGRRRQQQQDRMKQVEPLLGRRRYVPEVEPPMNSKA